MNRTEAVYAKVLEAQRQNGELKAWKFEPMRLILAPKTTYCPDFMVVDLNDEIELHEVKGFWRDDARVKIKVAATAFPWFRFLVVYKEPKKRGGGWRWEEVKP
jgi:hypothetical protein